MNNNIMIITGIVLIISSILFTLRWELGKRPYKSQAITVCFVVIITGVLLIISERIVEVTIPAIGTIKTAAKEANADATAISAIKARVESQSATIDLIAKDAAYAKQITNDLSEKSAKAEEKLLQLDKSIAASDLVIKNLESYTNFNATVLSAQNDNRPAYDQLMNWASDKSYPFQQGARQAVQIIMDQHDPTLINTGFQVPWDKGIDPQKILLSDLWVIFKNTRQPIVRLGIMEFIMEKRLDISKKDHLAFLINVINNDDDLQVVEYAGRYFAKGTGDNYKPIAIQAHQVWWDENQNSIKSDN